MIEVIENGVVLQLLVGDARGLDGVVRVVIIVIIRTVFIDEFKALGECVILPTAIVFIEICANYVRPFKQTVEDTMQPSLPKDCQVVVVHAERCI